ncbi:MAG TPA: hypothetical protein VMT24_14125, partial [Aggregatilineaceae bacterium]|nr:hypothetical protein [Aggregatilineaceae bacterium]
PVCILDAMAAPAGGWQPGDDELHRGRISSTVTALLALVGRNVEPVKDREHVLLSNIVEYAWRRGQDPTIEDMILQVQKPPFSKLGVFDVDTFFPEKERFSLAMELNNIIAAPSFQTWLQGEPLDIQNLLYTPEGKPRVSIFYIAHLSDAERMFIVTLLLGNILTWMRALGGTTSLRALLYFDEVFGFFPPHPYNPPSKEPILRMLKQARAFGLGLVIATQNPGDIDYKGLANAGTWFIGKLQTENDKNKVLSGLETVATVDTALNLEEVGRLLSTIDPRVFVMHNVHDNSPAFPMHTRWAMSYLRGPLTRQQIRTLMADQREQPYYPAYQQAQAYAAAPGAGQLLGRPASPGLRAAPPPPPDTLPEVPGGPPASLPGFPAAEAAAPPMATPPTAPAPGVTQPVGSAPLPVTPAPQPVSGALPVRPGAPARPAGLPEGYTMSAPPLPSAQAQYFLPSTISIEQAVEGWQQQTGLKADMSGGPLLVYQSMLIAQAEVRYADRKSGLSVIQDYCYHVTEVERAGLVQWDQYLAPYIDPKYLDQSPFGDAAYSDLSPGLTDTRRMTALKTELVDYIYKTAAVSLMHNLQLDLYGDPEMRRRDFLVKAQGLARQRRDQEVDQTVARYDKTFNQLETKLRRTAHDLEAEQKQLDALRGEEMWTTGEAALSLLRGRTTYTLSRVSRSRRYKGQAEENVQEAEQIIADLEAQLNETQAQMEDELRRINDKWAQIAGIVEEYRLTPFKKDIYLSVFGIGWTPQWLVTVNGQPMAIPAWAP